MGSYAFIAYAVRTLVNVVETAAHVFYVRFLSQQQLQNWSHKFRQFAWNIENLNTEWIMNWKLKKNKSSSESLLRSHIYGKYLFWVFYISNSPLNFRVWRWHRLGLGHVLSPAASTNELPNSRFHLENEMYNALSYRSNRSPTIYEMAFRFPKFGG